MSSPTKPEVLPAPVTERAYQPVYLPAIIGFLWSLAACFIFLVDDFWFLWFFPLPALLVSGIARAHIRRSEGTLAGELMATLGIVLSLVAGLGWLTKQTTAYLIIRQESGALVEDWLKKLQEGKTGDAFLDTVSPSQRAIFKPEDPLYEVKLRDHFGSPGGYTGFRGHVFVALARRHGQNLTLKPLGIADWKLEKGVYWITYRYEFSSEEMNGEFRITTTTSDPLGGSGTARPWRIDFNSFEPVRLEPTSKGIELAQARPYAEPVVRKFVSFQLARAMVVSSVGDLMPFGGEAVPAGRLLAGMCWTTRLAKLPFRLEELRHVPVMAALPTKDVKAEQGWVLDWEVMHDDGIYETELLITVQKMKKPILPGGWFPFNNTITELLVTAQKLNKLDSVELWEVTQCKVIRETLKKDRQQKQPGPGEGSAIRPIPEGSTIPRIPNP